MINEKIFEVLKSGCQLEPSAVEDGNLTLLDRSALSIAISLKRIADSVAAGPPIADAIYNSISEALFTAQRQQRDR